MKILCTKKELTQLVRNCSHNEEHEYCTGCVFNDVCAQGGDLTEATDIMVGIEDICEIVGESDG